MRFEEFLRVQIRKRKRTRSQVRAFEFGRRRHHGIMIMIIISPQVSKAEQRSESSCLEVGESTTFYHS